MRLSILAFCALGMTTGCTTATYRAHVKYQIIGSAQVVRVDSMLVGNNESRLVKTCTDLPWYYRFDGVPDLLLGFTATKLDTGTCHLRIFVDNECLDHESIPWGDVGGSASVFAEWP